MLYLVVEPQLSNNSESRAIILIGELHFLNRTFYNQNLFAFCSQEIQSLLLNWKGMDLTTYGELVLEGTFRVQRARSERTFFLFYKALLITKKRGDHFVYKTHIPV